MLSKRNTKAAIIPLSGGLDSTYLLYKILYERPDTDIHCVHVSLIKDGERYFIHERNASRKIHKFLSEKFPHRIKSFRNPSIDMTGFPMGLDTDGVLVMAQKLAYMLVQMKKYELIQLFIGLVADDGDYARFRNTFKEDGMNNRIWGCLLDSMIGRVNEKWWEKLDHKIQYPLYWEGIEKSDIINLMPGELLDMVWFCRSPKDGNPCDSCASCRTHKKALVRGNEINEVQRT